MRKQDIRTGVVYAYERGRSGIWSPSPCVLVSTQLRQGRSRYDKDGPWSRPGIDRPGVSMGRRTGYPAVFIDHGERALPEADLIALMLSVTPDCLDSGVVPDGLHLEILSSLTGLKGLYDQVVAERDEQRRIDSERRRREEAGREASLARKAAIIDRFAAMNLVVSRDYRVDDLLTLTADEAEKIAELLEQVAGER